MVILLALMLASALADSCNVNQFCEMERKRIRPPTRINDLIFSGQLVPNVKPMIPPPDPNRIPRLIDEVRSRIERVVMKGRKIDQLTQAEKRVINAMKRADFVTPGNNKFCKEQCGYNGLAFYFNQMVCLCERLEDFDDEFILFSMGHELGHAGDICNFRETKLKPGEHPFEIAGQGGSVVQCLEGLGIRSATEEDKRKIDWRSTFDERFYGKDPLERLEKHSQGNIHCYGDQSPSNIREGVADVVGIELVADYLKDHPIPQRPDNFRRIFGFLAERGCRQTIEQEAHPSDLDRIEKIALSIPAFRKALGCEGSPVKNCEYQPPQVKTSDRSNAIK